MIFTGNIGYDAEMKNHGPIESHLQTMLENLLQLANSSGLEDDSEGIKIFKLMYVLIIMYSLQVQRFRL